MSTQPNRGSQWRKWDLHVHTPLSILNNQFPLRDGEPDWEAYTLALEQSGCAVIGVTDYFTIDGYRRLKAIQEGGRLQGITLLPNIEFRLDKLILPAAGGSGVRMNLHVVFSDDVSADQIEEHFLHDIPFAVEGATQAPHEQRKLKRSNLESLGTDLQSEHARFRDRTALEIGATQAVVSLEKIAEILSRDSRFKGKYLVVLPEIYTSDIPWDGQDHNVRKVLLQASDMVFASNPKTRAWCLGQPPYREGEAHFVQEFGSLKACIHGSDAHDLSTIGRPCARRGDAAHRCDSSGDCEMRHCWVKADPTFEGLRQLLFEPVDRVRCQAVDPTPVSSPHSLDTFEIEDVVVSPELTLTGTTLALNSQLVVVAGGRGGGKTALVDLIANCYTDRTTSGDANSFVARIADEPAAVNVTLTLANGDMFAKEVADGTFYESSDLVYIAQGELEKQVTDTAALTAQIDSMILESGAVADTVVRYELDQAARRVSDLTRQLDARNKEVVRLESATSATGRAEVELALKKKTGSLEDIKKKIESARGKLSKERASEAETRQKELAALRDTAQKQERLAHLLQDADETITDSTVAMGNVIDEINEQLAALSITPPLPAFQYAGKVKLAALKTSLRDSRATTATAIEQHSKALAGLASEQEVLARALDLNKRTEGEVKGLKEQLAAIEKSDELLNQSRTQRSGVLSDLVGAVIDRRLKYVAVIELFSRDKDRLLNDLGFSAEVDFDETDLLGRAEELLDGRTARLRPHKEDPGALDAYVALARALFSTAEPDVAGFVAEAERLLAALRPALKTSRVANPLAIHDLLFRNYFQFKPSVLYKRLSLAKLSLGQKATVLIKIHLADGSVPIIIDSHDDHLDNEFIMDELVEGIRQAKQYRQVILVSNNGNVVVNSDAEQVIIAERDGTAITYRTGALEDPSIRDRLLSVLEGGRDAFNQRGRKYRLQ